MRCVNASDVLRRVDDVDVELTMFFGTEKWRHSGGAWAVALHSTRDRRSFSCSDRGSQVSFGGGGGEGEGVCSPQAYLSHLIAYVNAGLLLESAAQKDGSFDANQTKV